MPGLLAMFRDDRLSHAVRRTPTGEFRMVALPDAAALDLNAIPYLELCKEECGQHVAHDIAGADIHPRIFVHLTAKKSRPVGALLTDDLGTLDELVVVDEQRATLATGDVFGFVKTLGRQRAKSPQPTALVFSEK